MFVVLSGFGRLEGTYRSRQAAERLIAEITPGVNWQPETAPRILDPATVHAMNEYEESALAHAARRAEYGIWGRVA